MLSKIWKKVLLKTGIESSYRLLKIKYKKSNDKVKIVFLCQLPHIWTCLESIYEAAQKDDDVEAYILAVPNKWEEQEIDTEAYDFCVKNNYNVIQAYDKTTNKFFDLELLNPDYVFIPRPYDVYLPSQYRSDIISNYAKICYVCYGYVAEAGHILETCYYKYFTNSCYFIFADNDSTEAYCRKNHAISEALGLRKIIKTPFPRFDLARKGIGKEPPHWKIKRDEVNKRIIWTPRWTTDEGLGGTNFFNYKDFFFEFAQKHTDCEFMFRPHPMAFEHFISSGLMSKEEVDEYKIKCMKGHNTQLDERKDYLDSFASADILVSDMSGVMEDFLVIGKPLVFCSYQQEFNEANKKLLDAFYIPHDADELENILEMLISGNDPKKKIREQIVRDILGECDGKNGYRILEYLKADSKVY